MSITDQNHAHDIGSRLFSMLKQDIRVVTRIFFLPLSLPVQMVGMAVGIARASLEKERVERSKAGSNQAEGKTTDAAERTLAKRKAE